MRNQINRLRTLGAGVALIALFLTANATQAMAVSWSPPSTQFTGSTGPQSVLFSFSGGGKVYCDSTMTKWSSANGALLGAGSVTFANCNSTLPIIANGATTSGWTVTPNSTSTATINIPAGGLKLTKNTTGCVITVGSGAFTLPAQWSNVTHVLTAAFPYPSLPYTATGTSCATLSGMVTIQHTNGGWRFPTLSII
jgi:hypothetical protein